MATTIHVQKSTYKYTYKWCASWQIIYNCRVNRNLFLDEKFLADWLCIDLIFDLMLFSNLCNNCRPPALIRLCSFPRDRIKIFCVLFSVWNEKRQQFVGLEVAWESSKPLLQSSAIWNMLYNSQYSIVTRMHFNNPINACNVHTHITSSL